MKSPIRRRTITIPDALPDFVAEAQTRHPQGIEREKVNLAFDGLINELKTKETDQGTAIYEPNTQYSATIKVGGKNNEISDNERGNKDGVRSQDGPGDIYAAADIRNEEEITDNYRVRVKQKRFGSFKSPTKTVNTLESAAQVTHAAIGSHAQETMVALVLNKGFYC